MIEDVRCRCCMYADDLGDDEFMCKRYPPVVLKPQKGEPLTDAWQQPITSGSDWCGEFKVMGDTE